MMSFEEWLQFTPDRPRLSARCRRQHSMRRRQPQSRRSRKSITLPPNGTATEQVVALLRRSANADYDPMPERDDLVTERPIPPSVKNVWPRQKDVSRFYGAHGVNQTVLALPWPMRLAWDTSQTIRRMTLHKKVAESAGRCLERIGRKYPEPKRRELGLDLFAGSLNVRRMRGGSNYSMHSWGIAIDFDSLRNQLNWNRNRARLAKPDCYPFWEIWEEEGWVSLGRARNFDWMHVQAARL